MALGPLGRNGFASANRAAPQADVIIAIGAHFDVFSTLYKYGIFSENAKIIHQTSAAGQIGIVFPVTLGIAGSATSFISGLAARAANSGPRKAWIDVAKLRSEGEAELLKALKPEAEPIQPQFVAHAIRKALPENGILVVDAGNGGKHVRSYFKSYEPDTFLCMDDWAAVGGALPIAMGVKLARPDRPVLCTGGDMGAMCNIGELETAVRENIAVVYVVFNDQGLVSQAEYMVISEKAAVATIPAGIDFHMAAASLEAAHYAYNFVTKVKIEKGRRVLVNGATGGIGSAIIRSPLSARTRRSARFREDASSQRWRWRRNTPPPVSPAVAR
jgi:thiamine pyrophosphate-dependent acetolactate synthase large subunit-like protein